MLLGGIFVNIRMKQLICFFLALCMFGAMTISAYATDEEIVAVEKRTWVPSEDFPSSEELYDGYVQQLFYGNSVATYGTLARERLNPLGKKLYDFLKEGIEKIAAGEMTSTVFEIDEATLLSWGAQLDYDTRDTNAAFGLFLDQFQTEQVMSALLHDCPYEMYWFDKVCGMFQSAGFYLSGQSCSVAYLIFGFWVAGDCQPGNYNAEDPAVDPANIRKAKAAADKAKDIVDSLKDKTDYEKLCAYKETICDLVSYNYSAANGGSFSDNAAPWQLVYVFDGDAETKVVCEGYSKAFKYLCDLSCFDGPVACHCVSGAFASSGSGEPHMWNIVSIGNENYLVDVTNSDSGTVGSDGSLFLAGGTGSVTGGYAVSRCMYAYDYDIMDLWGTDKDSILWLSDRDFDPDAQPSVEEKPTNHEYADVVTPPTCTEQGFTTHTCTKCGDVIVDTYVDALDHTGGKATCLKKAVCTRCGAEYGELDANNHTYEHAFVPPTCTENGYDVYTCECGARYTQINAEPTDHKNSISGTVAPTVSSAGELTIACEVCGNTYNVYLPKLSEADYTYRVEIKPTVNSEGIGRYTWKVTDYGEIWFDVPLEKLTTMPGDMDGNHSVNDDDVILLLWHTLLPDMYPISGKGDLNDDGSINDDDVIYLLWHTLLPDMYPL